MMVAAPPSGPRHHCHALRCETACAPRLLMCPAHWRLVPLAIQRRIYRHFRAGQCVDKRPSREWCQAADDAVVAVGEAERVLAHDGKRIDLERWRRVCGFERAFCRGSA